MLIAQGCSCSDGQQLLLTNVFDHVLRNGRGFASAGAALDDDGIVLLKALEQEAVGNIWLVEFDGWDVFGVFRDWVVSFVFRDEVGGDIVLFELKHQKVDI
jgi:hypothetical protein